MSIFEDIFGGAKKILNGGKDAVLSGLSSKETYVQGGSSTSTGNKPLVYTAAKDIFLPGRGYSDQQIKAAQPTTSDKAIGLVKTAGEIVKGGTDVLGMIGRPIANAVLPGYQARNETPEAVAYRQKVDTTLSDPLKPTTPGQAKVMRAGDILGVLPVGSISKAGKVAKVFEEAAAVSKDTILTRLADHVPVVTGAPQPNILGVDKEAFIKELQNTTKPTVAQINQGLEMLRMEGKSVDDIRKGMANAYNPNLAHDMPVPRTPAGKVDVTKYAAQETKAREIARGEKAPIATRVTSFVQNIENKIVDFTAPIERRYKGAMKSDPLFAATQTNKSHIGDNIDRVFNTPAITSAFVKEHGFSEVIQGIPSHELDQFDQYLTAKHGIDLSEKGITTGRNLEADKALVQEWEPKFKQASAKIQSFNNARLDYMVESGLISKATKDELIAKHPNYVPFQRVFTEGEQANMGGYSSKGVASMSKQTVVQKIVGSNRKIESPLESSLALTQKAIQQGEKNKAALTLTSYKDIKGNPFGLKQLKEASEAAPDKGTISVLRDGKKEIWEVDADVAKAAKALNVEQMNILGKVLAFPVRIARLGITGVSPAFTAANVVRDQISSFIFSNHGTRSSIANPKVFLQALGGALGHGKLYDEMLKAGALSTSFDVGRDASKMTLKSIVADKSVASKAMYVATSPTQWFRAVEDAIGRSEEVTRMAQYKGAKDAALAKGMTEEEAITYAARAARENSTNFARRGEWGTVMNNAILFLNANIQGSRLLIRNLKNKPVQTTTKIATSLLMPTAAVTYWNMSDPKRKEAYDDIQDYEKENNLIFVPPNPVKDEKTGKWNVIKIPLPPGVGQLASEVRRPIEASHGGDATSFNEAALTLLKGASPIDPTKPLSSLTPQIVKPAIQYATNKDLFTGNDIVPKSLQGLPPEMQVKPNTSGTVRKVAGAMGVSPIKAEKFVTDTAGSVSSNVINAVDTGAAAAGAIPADQIGGKSVLSSIAGRFNAAAGNKTASDQVDEIYKLRAISQADSAKLKGQALSKYEEFQKLPQADVKTQLKEIASTNLPLFNDILAVYDEKKLGLSKPEAAMKQLPVADGTRAKYVYDTYKVKAAVSKADGKAYIIDLAQKKVITNEVLKQVLLLMSQDK